jgi:hypothetical protein
MEGKNMSYKLWYACEIYFQIASLCSMGVYAGLMISMVFYQANISEHEMNALMVVVGVHSVVWLALSMFEPQEQAGKDEGSQEEQRYNY